MNPEESQQFCLRWHNYQSSLLATLPQLLDGDDLTDVTLCAGNRSLKAHRVVLSACSEYFKELFKELGPSHHPVIVLPGVEFADLCALVTFMYSGEVNIYEPQLASLLSMADVLHIRGLADFSNTTNISQKSPKAAKRPRPADDVATPKPKAKTPSLSESDSYTDWLPSPNVGNFETVTDNMAQDLTKRVPPDSDVPANNNNNTTNVNNNTLDSDVKRSEYGLMDSYFSKITESYVNVDETLAPTDLTHTGATEIAKPTKGGTLASGSGVSKTYTICFICGKQLSNHYNLRVHMETHQNVQYACSACNHVSRSRDALRKHVAYRHPPGVDASASSANVAKKTTSP